MIEEEIEMALCLDEKFWRLKLILADNATELVFYDIISGGPSPPKEVDPQERLRLFYSFPKKVSYAVQEGVISGKKSEIINILHSYRNVAYHQAFDRIIDLNPDKSSFYDIMEKMRRTLAKFYLLTAMEVIRDASTNIEMKESYEEFIKKNEDIKTTIPDLFKTNLGFRIKRAKDNLAHFHIPGETFETIEIELDNFQRLIDHMFANYSLPIIEKSSFLDQDTKQYYLQNIKDWDYTDPESLDEDEKIVTSNDIKEWEHQIDRLETGIAPHVALKE